MGIKTKQNNFAILTPQGGGTYKKIARLMPHSVVALAGLFGLILFPISLAIDSTEATVTPSTTTLTLSTSDISVEIVPGNSAGTFVASDPATVSVTTNNYTGYTLGITSSDNVNNTKLTNTSDNTAYLTSISSASTSADFNVGNWGYLPSKLNGAANSAYQPAPTTTATTLEATNAANPTANEYTITLGAKADYSLPAGTYENTFTITAVANPVSYSITYDANTLSLVSNLPAPQSGSSSNETEIELSSNVPTRTNYEFRGWAINSDATTPDYQPGDIYYIDQTSSNSVTLYAVWQQTVFIWEKYTTIPSTYTQTTRSESSSFNTNASPSGPLCYQTYSFDKNTGKITGSGSSNNISNCYYITSTEAYRVTGISMIGRQGPMAFFSIQYDQIITSTPSGYTKGVFVSTVSSSSATAYPNNGTPDNAYWYVAMDLNSSIHTIIYNQNTTETVTNMPGQQQFTGQDATLSVSTPSREYYKFLGWSKTSTTSSPEYQPSGLYHTDSTNDDTTVLYAIWKPLYKWAKYNVNRVYALKVTAESDGYYRHVEYQPTCYSSYQLSGDTVIGAGSSGGCQAGWYIKNGSVMYRITSINQNGVSMQAEYNVHYDRIISVYISSGSKGSTYYGIVTSEDANAYPSNGPDSGYYNWYVAQN